MLRIMKPQSPSVVAISGIINTLIQGTYSGNIHNIAYYRAEVLRSHEASNPTCHAQLAEDADIGGDMNHIHRVTLQLCENSVGGDGKGTVVTVIVKTAPDEVLVCQDGERDGMHNLIRPASGLLLLLV